MSASENDDNGVTVNGHNPLRLLIGEAVESYVRIEQNLAWILEELLEVDIVKAHAVLFAIQNARSRYELFEGLLERKLGLGIRKYWASLSAFLLTLAQFRNAVAHWHPLIQISVGKSKNSAAHALHHPSPHSGLRPIIAKDFPLFLQDCMRAREELSALRALVETPPAALPERFRRRIPHRNQAVLQPPQTAKAPQPLRPPSKPSHLQKDRKPSAKQKRQRALSKLRRPPASS
jgi:hypothetical protein